MTNQMLLLDYLQTIRNKENLFLIGAGVSIQYVENNTKLYNKAIEIIMKSLNAEKIPITQSAADISRWKIVKEDQKLILHEVSPGKFKINDTNADLWDTILYNNPQIIELVCALAYSHEYDRFTIYPEYEFFNFFHHNSVMINFNHDNIAESAIRKMNVISAHGTVSYELRKGLKIALKETIFGNYTRIKPLTKKLILLTKESDSNLENNHNYNKFILNLRTKFYKNVIVIGYSFFTQGCGDIYDDVTFFRTRDYIKNFKPNLCVIDPNSCVVLDMLSSTLSCSKPIKFDVYWDCFSQSYFKCLYDRFFHPNKAVFNRRFNELYEICKSHVLSKASDKITLSVRDYLEIFNQKYFSKSYRNV